MKAATSSYLDASLRQIAKGRPALATRLLGSPDGYPIAASPYAMLQPSFQGSVRQHKLRHYLGTAGTPGLREQPSRAICDVSLWSGLAFLSLGLIPKSLLARSFPGKLVRLIKHGIEDCVVLQETAEDARQDRGTTQPLCVGKTASQIVMTIVGVCLTSSQNQSNGVLGPF